MGLRKIAALLAACLFLAGCAPQAAPAAASAAEPSAPAPAGRAASAEPPGSKSEPGPEPGGTYRLDPPRFLERKDWKLCPLAEDYLTLDGEAFAAKYPDDALWEQGASGRLLFDGRSTAPVIAGISVGDSFTRVRERLGAPQFGFSPDDVTGAPGKGAGFYATYAGYRTREFSVAFEGEAGGEVRSICICRRYPLPEERRDMLPVLAAHAPWYEVGGNDADADADWKRCFGEDAPVWYEQLGRGSMTLFCGYGFISMSTGEEDVYQVYADYEGDIPDIPEVEVLKADWPERQIWGIYDELVWVRAAAANRKSSRSPDGNIFAFAVSDGLFERAYVQFHWLDASHPDRQVRFGHHSSIAGFLSDRYLLETNMLGPHVYDIEKDEIVFSEPLEDGLGIRGDLRGDQTHRRVLDGDGNVWYVYDFASDGTLAIERRIDP